MLRLKMNKERRVKDDGTERVKAFLHTNDPVLCAAKEMAAHFNSHFAAKRTQQSHHD